MNLDTAWSAWRKFWFEPRSVTPVALFRIFFGVLFLQSLLIQVGPDFLSWYGPQAIVPLSAVKQFFWFNEPRFDVLLLLPQSAAAYKGYYFSLVLAGICLTIGLGTRISAAYVCLGLISLHHHDPFCINGGDSFLRLTSIWLPFSYCGHSLSIDNVIRRKRGIPVEKVQSPWAQRMIQLQLALAYASTFFCKISGTQWLDGTAVYYATRLDDLMRFHIPFIFDNIWTCRLLTWYTLFIEFAIWTLVWFREFRYPVLIGTFLLHFGIDLAINLPIFEWAFIACLVTYVYPEDADRVVDGILGRLRARARPESERQRQPAAAGELDDGQLGASEPSAGAE